MADQEPSPHFVLRFLIHKGKTGILLLCVIPLEYTSHEDSGFHLFCALHEVDPQLFIAWTDGWMKKAKEIADQYLSCT